MSAKAELRLVDGLQLALERQALHMVYQPKVSLKDGALRQVEAVSYTHLTLPTICSV